MTAKTDWQRKLLLEFNLVGLQKNPEEIYKQIQECIVTPELITDRIIVAADREDKELVNFYARHIIDHDLTERFDELGRVMAFYDYRVLIVELLDKGVKLGSILRGAALGGQKDLVNRLLSMDAPINAAIQLAALGDQREMVFWLLTKGACRNSAVYWAAGGDNRELTIELLRRGACLNAATLGAIHGKKMCLMMELMNKGLRNMDVGGGKRN